MDIVASSLPGVMLLSSPCHTDERGYFLRTFDAAEGRAAGIDLGPACQDSLSRSEPGVLRGMHGRSGGGEAKLVRCVSGAVLDMIVDVRPDSPSFGQHLAVELNDETQHAVWIPRGFLHGYQVLRGPALVAYRIDSPHDPSEDLGVRYDDPELALPWRGAPSIVSARDADLGSWAQLRERLGR